MNQFISVVIFETSSQLSGPKVFVSLHLRSWLVFIGVVVAKVGQEYRGVNANEVILGHRKIERNFMFYLIFG